MTELPLPMARWFNPLGMINNYFKNPLEKLDRRRRCRLAISTTPDADSWQVLNVTDYANRSAYPTIFQVQSNRIVYQSDLELYQIHIPTP